MEDTATKFKHGSVKISKVLPKSSEEPLCGKHPPRAVFAEIRKERVALQKKKDSLKKIEKVDLFIEEWLKNDGNATEAALKVFNCKSRSVAASIGTEYLKKARGLVRVSMEKEGYTYGKMIRIAGLKMEKSKGPEWWDRLMKLGGYEDFMTKKEPSVSVNILNAQKDVLRGYIQDIEVLDMEEEDVTD